MIKNKKLNNKKRISPNTVALIGAILITLGGFFLLYNFINSGRLYAYDYMNNRLSEDTNTEVYDVKTTEVTATTDDSSQNEEIKTDVESYIGYLEIPKIKFKRGFYNIDSDLNTVELNIEVIKGSSMPDVHNGNLIIAGHSGTGWKAFFKDLYKLALEDTLTVTYNGQNYIYKITNIYKEANTGTISIKRDKTKNTVTLVTCTKDDSSTQTIYIAELQEVK